MSERDAAPQAPQGYRIRHRIGSGQTSHVYLAEHARFGRVALKLPRPELEHRPVLRRMFESEVMITLRLSHPRVVRALEGHPTGPSAFLALEVCGGGTLDQLLLERGRLPLGEAVRLVEDVAEGLAYTHGQKVLHRDVKPANVFLDDDGRGKLGDFGTGVFMAEDSGKRVGTAFYMAPEIFEGGSCTPRSDIYALGVLAYEVLTGERPFSGDSVDALMHAHLGGLLRDPRSLRPDMPVELARAVRTAMARLPERRYERVVDVLEAVRDATPDGRVAPEPEAAAPQRTKAGRSTRVPRDRMDGDGGAGSTVQRGAPSKPSAEGSGDAAGGDERPRGSGRAPWWRRLFGDGGDDAS